MIDDYWEDKLDDEEWERKEESDFTFGEKYGIWFSIIAGIILFLASFGWAYLLLHWSNLT